MPFLSNRRVKTNFDFFSACAWYVPGVSGLFAVLGWFIVGMILGSLAVMPLMFAMPEIPLCYSMLIMYPLQFIPAMIFVKIQSGRNSVFEKGYALDSSHFGKLGGFRAGLAVVAATLAASLMLELANHFLPEMGEGLEKTMEALLGGPLWVSLLCTAVFAPVFEEWLCRGVILRGLLNHERPDEGKDGRRGMSPALAIVVSAIFFAAIHGNLWQGITAFAIGCLLGYVYYKTGSLKLTILMHCTNNTLSVLMAHFGGEEVQNAKSLLDIVSWPVYAAIFVCSGLVLWFVVRKVSRIEQVSPRGNCDEV